jgi:methionyl-tRNA formyltransferase
MRTRSQSGTPTFCLQRIPEDGRIDWRQPAARIDRLVRAVSRPYPGAFSDFESRRVIVWRSELPVESMRVFGAPGQLCRLPGEADPVVVAGEGYVILRAAEIDGQDAMPLLRKSPNMRFSPS